MKAVDSRVPPTAGGETDEQACLRREAAFARYLAESLEGKPLEPSVVAAAEAERDAFWGPAD